MAKKTITITVEIEEEILNKSLSYLKSNNLTIESAVEKFLSHVQNEKYISHSDDEYLGSIATVLAGHYDYIYYVDMEDNSYLEFNTKNEFRALEIGETGKDFFTDTYNNIDMIIYKDDRDRLKEFFKKENFSNILKDKKTTSIVYRMIISPKPEYYVLAASISSLDPNKVIIDVKNIDESIRREQQQTRELEKASYLAHLDSLTKCLNYLAFQEVKDEISLKIKNNTNDFALAMCDLNDLKNINDDEGHIVGDEYLIKTAHILKDMFPHSRIYRIGGDEFFVVIEGEDYENRYSLVDALKAVSVTNQKYNAPVIAIGLAELNENIHDFSSMFVEADKAMYEHKKLLKTEK